MKVKILIFLLLLLLINNRLYAQETQSAIADPLANLPNPFKSPLPKIIKKERIKTPVTALTEGPSRRRFESSTTEKPEGAQPVQPVDRRAPQPVLPSVTISGLIWNSDRPQAIINGQVVDIGDTVNEMKIVRIEKDGIDLSYQGAIMTVKP